MQSIKVSPAMPLSLEKGDIENSATENDGWILPVAKYFFLVI